MFDKNVSSLKMKLMRQKEFFLKMSYSHHRMVLTRALIYGLL